MYGFFIRLFLILTVFVSTCLRFFVNIYVYMYVDIFM